jgi:hypothetical protein
VNTFSNLKGKFDLLEHNSTALSFKINIMALPLRVSILPERYDFTYIGEHIFKLKTTLTDHQAYPAIPDPYLTKPLDLEVTFKVTITSKCENARMIKPTGGFKDIYYFIDSPSKTFFSFDKLEDGVVPLNKKFGTYFCGLGEWSEGIQDKD